MSGERLDVTREAPFADENCPQCDISEGHGSRDSWKPGIVQSGSSGPPRRALRAERCVDQSVIRAINLAVVVQIAVEPAANIAAALLGVLGVDAGIIGAVNLAVEVRVAVVGVLHENGGVAD